MERALMGVLGLDKPHSCKPLTLADESDGIGLFATVCCTNQARGLLFQVASKVPWLPWWISRRDKNLLESCASRTSGSFMLSHQAPGLYRSSTSPCPVARSTLPESRDQTVQERCRYYALPGSANPRAAFRVRRSSCT